jgi:hypothetical protein
MVCGYPCAYSITITCEGQEDQRGASLVAVIVTAASGIKVPKPSASIWPAPWLSGILVIRRSEDSIIRYTSGRITHHSETMLSEYFAGLGIKPVSWPESSRPERRASGREADLSGQIPKTKRDRLGGSNLQWTSA